MIKNRTALISSVILLAISMALYFPYPNNKLIGANVVFMSFPIQNVDGFVLKGIFCSVLFLAGMAFLIYGLKKFYVVFAILVLFAYALLPGYLITGYQKTLASGIGAISYDNDGKCAFDTLEDMRMTGQCSLSLKNNSKEPVTFELEFIDSIMSDNDARMESLLNIEGPYVITIDGKSEEFIQLDEVIDVSDVPNHFYSGSTASINFKLIEGKKERIF